MAVEDEVRTEGEVTTEGSSSYSSSFVRDSLESDEKRDVLSAEDIAWVDSCLLKESEISDGNWNSMKDALLEVLSSQLDLYNSPASVSDRHPTENDIEMLTSREGAEADRSVEDEVRTEGEVTTEGLSSSSSSFVRDSQESDEKRDVLSAEDIAWVDSCLLKESEISDGNWNLMKDALLEVLSSQPDLYNSPSSVSDTNPTENDIEMLTSREGAEADRSLEMGEEINEVTGTPNDISRIKEEAESSNGNFLTKDTNDLQSLPFVGNPFLPSYTNGLKETQTIESGSDLSLSGDETEPSTKDIFRVWDLNIRGEENELDKQLNKILEESDLQSELSVFDDSSAGKDLKEESLDDVIAAISEISLK